MKFERKERGDSAEATPRQILLFDADDTLWENNIYFERAIADFISFLDHASHTPEQVREHLNKVERATVAEHGYGTESFRRSLTQCFRDLSRSLPNDRQTSRITHFVDSIVQAEIVLLNGVQETLHALRDYHSLALVTKGDLLEQLSKLDRSGLAPFFATVEVLHEKDEATYREITDRHGWDRHSTWMIGNSPKSDINPALAAGLNAIFIAHGDTWILEHESLLQPPAGQQLLSLKHIGELPLRLEEQLSSSAAAARSGERV